MMNLLFPPTSRYYSIETTVIERPNGEAIIYLKRRFVPAPEGFHVLKEHVVAKSERLDNVTALYLDDPEQFWRVCDANRAMIPRALVETEGRRLRITLPEGIPGAPHA